MGRMSHRGEFPDDRPSRCCDMAIYQFSKWLLSAILIVVIKLAVLTTV